MSSITSHKHFGPLAGGLLAAGVLALLVATSTVRLGPNQQELLANAWRTKLATLADDDIPGALRQLAEHGELGIPLLVEAAGSYRASVALAASSALVDEMNRIAQLSAPESAPRLAVLARALAEHVEDYGPTTRGLAAYLAERILRAPYDAGPVERAALLADCRTIMEIAADSRRPASADLNAVVQRGELVAEPVARLASNARSDQPRAAANPDASQIDPATDREAARGALAVETARIPKLPRGTLPASSKLPEPRLMPDIEDEVLQPQRFVKPPSVKQLPAETEPRPAEGSRSESATPSPDARRAPPRKLDTLDIEQVVALLGAAESRVVKAAHVELERRGFSPLELEIAAKATDDNPHVRRELASQLLSITGLDARPWLIMLSRDPADEVRLAAVSLLATRATDPTIATRLEEIARDERDARIAGIARRAVGRSSSRRTK